MAGGRPKHTEDENERRAGYVSMLCSVTMETDKGIKRICDTLRANDPTFPAARTIREWIAECAGFGAQYARAKEIQADYLVDQIIEISDDSSEDEIFIGEDDESGASGKRVMNSEFVQRSKLKIEARKWVASKLLPKKYGDKIEQTHQNPDGTALDLTVNFVSPPNNG